MAENTENKPLSGKLIAGIFFLPFVFAWFTLKKGVSTKAKVLSFLWLFAYIGGIGGQQSENPLDTSSSGSKATIAGSVTGTEIYQAYEANEVAADTKYKDKFWSVSGTISDIGKDILDNPYVLLDDTLYGVGGVQASFAESELSKLGSLNKGNQITIVCKISGKVINVQCKDSKIAE